MTTLAKDFSLLFGTSALEEIVENVKFSKEQEDAANKDPMVLQAVSAEHILQAYLYASREATALLGQDNVLSTDWDRAMSVQFHEFENMRAAALGKLRAHLSQQSTSKNAQATIKGNDVLLEEEQFVEILIKSKGPLGYLVKVNRKYDGLVYHNDIFQDPPSVGDVVDGWVLKVREDGKVDVTLRPPGAVAKISEGVERLLQALEKNGKRLTVGDKSSPTDIYNAVGLSKKVFKEALGHMYKRKMVVFNTARTEVSLQPMDRWETGIVGAKDEPPPSKAKAPAAAAAAAQKVETTGSSSDAKDKAKKARATRKKSLYQGEYRALPKVPLHGAVEGDTLKAEQDLIDLLPKRTEATTQLAKKEVEQRRAGVEATLREDEAHFKSQAQERLAKAKAAKMAKMQVEHQKRVAGLKHEVVDVAEQERRKELLKSTRGLTGNGLKATMERMKALKASKAQALGTAADADTDDPSSAAAPPAPAKALAPPRAQPAGTVRCLLGEAYGGVDSQFSAGSTASEGVPVEGGLGGWVGGRVPSASSEMQDIGGAVTVEVCLCYVS